MGITFGTILAAIAAAATINAGEVEQFPDGSRVAFFGDSITRNGGGILRVAAHYKKAFPGRDIRFFNCGISGGGLAAAEMYFDSMLAARKPTHVVLAFGVNDSGAPEGFRERYAALVGRIEALGAKVILRTATPYNEFGEGTVPAVHGKDAAHRRIADEIRAFAKERGLQFLDDYEKMRKCLADGEDVFNGDRVHPNDLGQWRMAETLLSAQGLTIEPYRPRSEVAASSGLAQWESVSQKIANLNSAEWLVVRDESLDVPAKIAKMEEWLSTKGAKPGANQFVVRIAKDYLRDKPQESALYAELDNAVGAYVFAPVAPHPRLFADDAEFAAAKARISSCEEGRAALAVLMRTADSTLSEKPLERKMKGRRLLDVSRSALERIGCLAFAWRYTGDLRYAERAAEEARAVCAFSDWNPGHFLDVGEMTLAAALARDWLDGFLPDDDKRAISSAILRKGLTAGDGRTLPDGWWVKCGNNWNQVCNGGLSAGAAAVRDEFPEIAQAILLRARNALPFALKAYAGGNFPEGPGYWEYATDYTAIALDVMERQFADGAPELFASDGLADQVDYIDCMTGPTGFLFNYSDPLKPFTRRLPIASCWYLARRFGRYGALEAHERPLVRAGFGAGRMLPFLLLWLSEPPSGSSADSPLCRVLGGENPVAVLRSGRGENDWYVGVKGGCPSANHGHMDAGSFVVDAAGVRWACDLGCEGYNRIEQMTSIDLWNCGQESSRWSLFRLGTDGHGTLVVDGKPQNVKGCAKITGENPAVADLTPLYPDAKKVVRKFTLDADGLKVEDCVRGLRPGTVVTWNMNTPARAIASGGRLVLETEDPHGALRRMELAAGPAGVAWECESIAEPRTAADSPNPGMTRVRLRSTAGADGAVEFAVSFRLLGAANPPRTGRLRGGD